MPNRRNFDAITSANFRVEIEGVTQDGFFSVDFLDVETAVVEYRTGGDPIVRKIPGLHRFGNIVLRRGWSGDPALWRWRQAVLEGRVERKAGSIIIMDVTGASMEEISRFNFFEGWPCRWRLGPWDASADAPLIETIEIAVEKVEAG